MSRLRVIRLTKEELRIGALLYPERGYWRPTTRGECSQVVRPCPYVGCRYHLYLDVDSRTGSLKINADREPWELARSCALDVADEGRLTLEQVASTMQVTRERVRQIEQRAREKIAIALEGDE